MPREGGASSHRDYWIARFRGRRQLGIHAALQCAQMPEISITGVFGVKPAAREAVLMVSATAAAAASPTAPQRPQIGNTTGSPVA
jgi:hypothetical protein